MKLLFLNTLLFISSLTYCQNQENYEFDYTPLISSGEIPSDYKKLASEKYNEDINSLEGDSENLSSEKKKFLLLSNYEINQTLFSGRVLFGDKITAYLNKILDELLKNDTTLRSRIRIYTFKSSTVNAACTSNGTIFINIGLLARLENEAELAFIIAHEISHFVKQHSLNKYIEKERIFDAKESFDQKINKLFTQSKEKEFEADSLGVLLFLKSKYNVNAIASSLDKLYYSYLPYKEVLFNKNFFNGINFDLPHSLFLDSVSQISPIGNFNDRYLTHPHVTKRKLLTAKIIKKQTRGGNQNFIISETEFNQVQELSRFENIRLSLLQKQYGDIIYYAHDLLQTYPDNIYLKIAVCKALYGLAKYKNFDEYQEVAKSYHRTEGEIQQIHYLLRKLNRFQMNVAAIKYIQKTIKEHPNNKFIKRLMDNLIEDLVVIHGVKVKEYFNTSFDNEVATDRKLFHKNAFVEELKNEKFINNFEQHYPKLDSLNEWKNLDYKTKIKLKEALEKKEKKYGLSFVVKKVIVLDPSYKFYNEKVGDFIDSEKRKSEFIKQILAASKEFNLQIEIINSKELSSKNLSSYNDLSMLKEWMNEVMSHNNNNIIPFFSDQIKPIIKKYNTNLLYFTGLHHNSSYFVFLINLESGIIQYSNYKILNNISEDKAYRLIKKDIEFIMK